MTIDEIIERINDMSGDDAEADHADADSLLLEVLRQCGQAAVVDAYEHLISRARFWATA